MQTNVGNRRPAAGNDHSMKSLHTIEHSPVASSLSHDSSVSLCSWPSSPFPRAEDIDLVSLEKDFRFAVEENSKCGETANATKLFELAARTGQELHRLGKSREAALYFKHALHLKNKTITEESIYIQRTFADVLFDVGAIHSRLDDQNKPKAIQAFQLCLDLRKVAFGPDHPSVASACYSLASLYASIGDMESSENLLQEALSILLFKCHHQDHLKFVWVALGKVQEALGKDDEAKSSMVEVRRLEQAKTQ